VKCFENKVDEGDLEGVSLYDLHGLGDFLCRKCLITLMVAILLQFLESGHGGKFVLSVQPTKFNNILEIKIKYL